MNPAERWFRSHVLLVLPALALCATALSLTGCLGKGLDIGDEYRGGPVQKPIPPTHIPGMLLGFNGDHLIGNIPEDTNLPHSSTISIPFGKAAQTSTPFLINAPAGPRSVQLSVYRDSTMPWPIPIVKLTGPAELTIPSNNTVPSDIKFNQTFGGTNAELDVYYFGGLSKQNGSTFVSSTNYPFFLLNGSTSSSTTRINLAVIDSDGAGASLPKFYLKTGMGTITSHPNEIDTGSNVTIDSHLYHVGAYSPYCTTGSPNEFASAFFELAGILPWEINFGFSIQNSVASTGAICPSAITGIPFDNTGDLKIGSPSTITGMDVELIELFIFNRRLTYSEHMEMLNYFRLRYAYVPRDK